jgi:MFS family permease
MKQESYKHYMIAVLLAITAHNYVDRTTLGLLLQSIKIDLNLTDTQLGVLTGIAFALFYSAMGIPIARWADRGNRVTIVSVTTALWSMAVIVCGGVQTFQHLLLIRIAVAVGEAGCLPPTHSLIADHFTRAERARAVAIYMLGGPLGMLVGYLSAGWLGEFFGWRNTFVMLGVPGLLLALVAWFTLREPRLASASAVTSHVRPTTGEPQGVQLSLKEACQALWANATFRNIWLSMSVSSFFGYGILQWLPSFFARTHGLQTGEIGTWFAAIYGVGGLVGTYFGGVLASRYAANNERLQLKAIAVAYVVFAVLSAGVYLAPNPYMAFAFLAFAMVGGCTMNGPLFAIIQMVVPDRMRATAIAIVYLFGNLIGLGLGPLAAGALSDAFRPMLGDESLRYALLLLCPGYLWPVWYVWKSSRTVDEDMAHVSQVDWRPAAGRSSLRDRENLGHAKS